MVTPQMTPVTTECSECDDCYGVCPDDSTIKKQMEQMETWTDKGYWGTRTLGDIFDQTVQKHPNNVAIVQGGKQITYGEMGIMVNRLAFGLLELGIGKHDYVIVELPNCFECAYVQYALAKIGAVHVPIVHTYRQAEIDYVVQLFRAKAIIVPDTFGKFSYTDMVHNILPKHPYLRHAIVVGENAPSGMIPFGDLIRERADDRQLSEYLLPKRPAGADILRAQLSAGTTGRPKAALHSHDKTICSLEWDAVRHQWGDVLLLFFPFGHATGFLVSLDLQTLLGRKIVLFEGKMNIEEVLKVVEKEGVTAMYLPVPTMSTLAAQLKERPELVQQYRIDSLQNVVFGGTPAPAELIETIRESLNVSVLQVYGMAEGIVTSPDLQDPPEVQAFSVGRVGCPDADLRVVDDDNRVLPIGAVGELIYKGPFIFSGYYRDRQLNKQAFDEGGYVHSGDLVKMDEKGNIWIVGRKKDIIRRGGEGISPAEIEDLLSGHPKIADVSIVAMPDKRMGEKVCAYVVPKAGQTITFDEIITFLKNTNIATFKLPERVEIVDILPRSASKGNVLKGLLREDISNKLKAEGKV